MKHFEHSMGRIDERLASQEAKGVRYIPKKTFKQAADKGLGYRIVGRTCLKPLNSDKTAGQGSLTGTLDANRQSFLVDSYGNHLVKGYIPVGEGRYIEYVGAWIPLFFIVLLLAAAAIAAGIFLMNQGTIEPDWNNIKDEENVEKPAVQYEQIVVDLPEGTVHYESPITQAQQNSTDPYSGSVHLLVQTEIEGAKHTVVNQDATVTDGKVAEFTLDFPSLDFELKTGTIDGTVEITYPDGTKAEKPAHIIIRQSNTGKVEVGYSNEVSIDQATGAASMRFSLDANATHDAALQLVLVKGDSEYVLAQSDRLRRGDTLTTLTVDSGMRNRLTTGTYKGFLRVFFDGEIDKDASSAVKTDIEVSITVQ